MPIQSRSRQTLEDGVALVTTDNQAPIRTECPCCKNMFSYNEVTYYHYTLRNITTLSLCKECCIQKTQHRCHYCECVGNVAEVANIIGSRALYGYAPAAGAPWVSFAHVPYTYMHITELYVCAECASTCNLFYDSSAGVYTDSSRRVQCNNGESRLVWDHFVYDHADFCTQCRSVVSFTETHNSREGFLCDACESYGPHTAEVLSYSHRPPPIFYTTKKVYYSNPPKSFFFGAEIELDVDEDDHPQIIADAMAPLPNVYVKEDGSISHGAEIVTHPMSFGAWKRFNKFFDALRHLEDKGASGERNGVHVHISRKPFYGPDNEVKFRTFIHALMDRFPKTYEGLVGREPNSYCSRLCSINNFRCKTDAVSRHQDRYSAVNFSNSHTIELRSFIGSTDREILLSYIEFCDSSVAFALNSDQEYLEGGPVLTPYYKFLKEYRNRYKFLIARIKKDSIGGAASCVL